MYVISYIYFTLKILELNLVKEILGKIATVPVSPQNIPRLNLRQSKFLYLIEPESRIQQSVKKEKKVR